MDDPPPLAGPSRALSSPSTAAPFPLSNLLLQLGNTNPSPLSGSQDLLSLFHLNPLYETYVRPYLPPPAGEAAESPRASGKGKEKAVEGAVGFTSLGFTMGGVRIGGEVDKVKKAKMDKSYAHLIQDIPGRNTIKKDKHLRDLVLNPDTQPVDIQPFDAHALRDAFTLKPGQIPGFDAMIWESEAEVPKKKKKKRRHEQEGGAGAGEEEHRKKKKRKAEGDSSP